MGFSLGGSGVVLLGGAGAVEGMEKEGAACVSPIAGGEGIRAEISAMAPPYFLPRPLCLRDPSAWKPRAGGLSAGPPQLRPAKLLRSMKTRQ